MLPYHIGIALILLAGIPLRRYPQSRGYRAAYLAVTFGYLFLLSALRCQVGYDFDVYAQGFQAIRRQPFWDFSYSGWEPGFLLYQKLLGALTGSTMAFMALTSLLILTATAWFLYRHSSCLPASAFLYVTFLYYFGTMNFLRQNMAAAIALMGYSFLKQKQFVPYLLVVLAASSFHVTALLLLPLYWVLQIPFTRKTGFLFLGCTTVFYFLSDGVAAVLGSLKFAVYPGGHYDFGMSIVYALPSLVMMALGMLLFRRMKAPDAGLLVNASMVTFLFSLLITRHMYLERLSLYTGLLSLVLVPELAQAVASFGKNEKEQALFRQYFYVILGILCLVYYIWAASAGNIKSHGAAPYHTYWG